MNALNDLTPEASFDRFLDSVKPKLGRVLIRYHIPAQDSEDILQQCLLALVYRFKEIHDPEAWLIGTLRNKCLLYWRERRRRLYDAVDETVLEWAAEPAAPGQDRRALRHDLDNLISRLPGRCQEVLRLRYGLGYDLPEVAQELGYRASSMSKITTRCLAALTRQMVVHGMLEKDHDAV